MLLREVDAIFLIDVGGTNGSEKMTIIPHDAVDPSDTAGIPDYVDPAIPGADAQKSRYNLSVFSGKNLWNFRRIRCPN